MKQLLSGSQDIIVADELHQHPVPEPAPAIRANTIVQTMIRVLAANEVGVVQVEHFIETLLTDIAGVILSSVGRKKELAMDALRFAAQTVCKIECHHSFSNILIML